MTKLQKQRKEAGLSQQQLAIKSKINVRAIQDYEQGRRDLKNAKAITVKNLAKALNCPMEKLV